MQNSGLSYTLSFDVMYEIMNVYIFLVLFLYIS